MTGGDRDDADILVANERVISEWEMRDVRAAYDLQGGDEGRRVRRWYLQKGVRLSDPPLFSSRPRVRDN